MCCRHGWGLVAKELVRTDPAVLKIIGVSTEIPTALLIACAMWLLEQVRRAPCHTVVTREVLATRSRVYLRACPARAGRMLVRLEAIQQLHGRTVQTELPPMHVRCALGSPDRTEVVTCDLGVSQKRRGDARRSRKSERSGDDGDGAKTVGDHNWQDFES